MADKIKMEEARARVWISEVNTELELVNDTLTKVTQAITSVPASDDTIMNGILKVGNTLEDIWATTCKVFREVGKGIEGIITKTVADYQEREEALNAAHGRMGGR